MSALFWKNIGILRSRRNHHWIYLLVYHQKGQIETFIIIIWVWYNIIMLRHTFMACPTCTQFLWGVSGYGLCGRQTSMRWGWVVGGRCGDVCDVVEEEWGGGILLSRIFNAEKKKSGLSFNQQEFTACFLKLISSAKFVLYSYYTTAARLKILQCVVC